MELASQVNVLDDRRPTYLHHRDRSNCTPHESSAPCLARPKEKTRAYGNSESLVQPGKCACPRSKLKSRTPLGSKPRLPLPPGPEESMSGASPCSQGLRTKKAKPIGNLGCLIFCGWHLPRKHVKPHVQKGAPSRPAFLTAPSMSMSLSAPWAKSFVMTSAEVWWRTVSRRSRA